MRSMFCSRLYGTPTLFFLCIIRNNLNRAHTRTVSGAFIRTARDDDADESEKHEAVIIASLFDIASVEEIRPMNRDFSKSIKIKTGVPGTIGVAPKLIGTTCTTLCGTHLLGNVAARS